MARRLTWSVVLAVALGLAPAARAVESYFGFDLDLLAKSFAYLTTYRTQYGEAEGNERFAAWLREQGKTRETFDAAYDLWWKHWKADPTGESEARFHTLNSRYVNEMNFGDVPSKAQERQGGVTLEEYARVSVALSQPPANDTAEIEKRLKAAGVKGGMAQWSKVNEAWGAAMKADTTFALVQQYAALYQKYAGPGFAAAQEAKTAQILAEHNREPAPPRETPPPPPGIESALARLTAGEARERWSGAREVLRLCDLWAGPARRDPKDARAAHCTAAALRSTALPQLIDALDHHGDETIEFATNGLDFLADLGLKEATVRSAVERALQRDRDRLAKLEADFAPIQDKAVPERMFLRPKIDGYRAAVRDLESALRSW
jgi:hypothetical protein